MPRLAIARPRRAGHLQCLVELRRRGESVGCARRSDRQPRTSRYSLPASVGHTCAGSRYRVGRGGHIYQRIETYRGEHLPRAPLARSILRRSSSSLATRPAIGRLHFNRKWWEGRFYQLPV